ncbi:MAG: glycosyltransferase family 4 protein [Candidatus Marinimicrobia bacterium]|nr:glycosyltransferase family 4 protein [Candidatus Neomarinimicrobiota bacterium]MCF7828733.1 glycosyltransferase family 4 protein [Candidatus Neomarinimicrobiota bacterium]MCF7880650.1 glycosyltransferase family 4 protein [Candidatus Neomarinimicrobiota bacterium]
MLSGRLLFVINHTDFFLSHRLPIALAAADKGLSVHVASMKTPAANQLTYYNITWHQLPLEAGGMNPFSDLNLLIHLVSLYKSIKPDLIHHVTIKPIIYGGIASRLTKMPAVVHALSGLGFLFIANDIKTKFIRKILSIFLKFAFTHKNLKLILQNPDDRREFVNKNIVNEEKVKIIKGSGVDPNKFKPSPKQQKNTPKILFASRMLRDKGLIEFINASEIIVKMGYKAKFILVGTPDSNNPQSVTKEQLHKFTKHDFISWEGYRSDMEHVFHESDIVCLPSYREGLPKVLIEAASCGKPIVTTDVPGCREIVKNGLNGFLVPPKDSKSLANAIIKLIDNPALRKRMGKNGREMVLKEFTLEKVISDTLNIYQELLKKEYKP